MKKQIIILGLIGLVILVSTFMIFSVLDSYKEKIEMLDQTPSDNYPEVDRSKYCGIGNAKSTRYVKEYKIPTECTQPQAIMVTSDGNVWFAQSNMGRLAKFNPLTETFTQYNNRFWPSNQNTMISGIDYASDNSIWFTDDTHDSVWKFNIDEQDYHRFSFPSEGNSIPQKLKIIGSQMIINDLTGNRLAIFDLSTSDQEMKPFLLSSPNQDYLTSSFVLDDQKNIWYPNWKLDSFGTMIKINGTSLTEAMQNTESSRGKINYSQFLLPFASTINGIALNNNKILWAVDSSSSYFYKYDTKIENGTFTRFFTTEPPLASYGNFTGNVESPISRPNWIQIDSQENIIFNESEANRIGLFDPQTEVLVEYDIPSRNPFWADCGDEKNCGISQVLEFTLDEDKIWFSEWAENNIGYVDTSVSLPVDISFTPKVISLKPGENSTFNFIITPTSENQIQAHPIINHPYNKMEFKSEYLNNKYLLNPETPLEIPIFIQTDKNISPNQYKILLGIVLDDVSYSRFFTVNIEN